MGYVYQGYLLEVAGEVVVVEDLNCSLRTRLNTAMMCKQEEPACGIDNGKG